MGSYPSSADDSKETKKKGPDAPEGMQTRRVEESAARTADRGKRSADDRAGQGCPPWRGRTGSTACGQRHRFTSRHRMALARLIAGLFFGLLSQGGVVGVVTEEGQRRLTPRRQARQGKAKTMLMTALLRPNRAILLHCLFLACSASWREAILTLVLPPRSPCCDQTSRTPLAYAYCRRGPRRLR